MNDINPLVHQHAGIREAVRDVCRAFDSAYWQEVEESSGYPEAFVLALTQAGWLAALIPEEFGGGGASLSLGDPRRDQSLRRELGRLPRADVHHGDPLATWLA